MKQWQARTTFILCFVIGAGVILISRLYGLDLKPIHHDESINMWWVSEIWNQGYFPYDPTNYHGPLMFYLFQWMEALGATSLVAYRALTSLFNVALIALIFGWSYRYKKSTWIVAALIAVSPAMIFFSRSAIHESAFVFFQVLAFLGVIDFLEGRRTQGLRFFVWGLLGAVLLKETFVLPVMAGAGTLGLLFFARRRGVSPLNSSERKDLFIQSAAALIIWGAMYSGFYAHLERLIDFFKAFLPWTQVGVSGNGHEKSFFYWLELIVKHEPLALSALVFTVAGFFVRSRRIQGFGIFALVNLFFYSIIPYKTPWCLISILWPLYFSGVESFRYFWPRMKVLNQRVLVFAALALSISQVKQAVTINYQKPLDLSHDYVYVQTTQSAQDAFDFILGLAKKDPQLLSKSILIYTEDQWPFPMALKKFSRMYSLRPEADLKNLEMVPENVSVVISASNPESQQKIIEKLGVERLPCQKKFREDLQDCEFILRTNVEPFQIIFVRKTSKP